MIYNQRCYFGTSWAVNSIPYLAEYFGQKIQFDQNDKLIACVATIDGHSRWVVATRTMPINNDMVIYEKWKIFFQQLIFCQLVCRFFFCFFFFQRSKLHSCFPHIRILDHKNILFSLKVLLLFNNYF